MELRTNPCDRPDGRRRTTGVAVPGAGARVSYVAGPIATGSHSAAVRRHQVGTGGRPTAGGPHRHRPLRLTHYLAAAYVASVPFDGFQVGQRSAPFVMGVVFAVVAVVELVGGRDRFVVPSPLAIGAIFVFAFYASVSYFWAFDADAAFARIPTVVVLTTVTILLAGFLPPVWRGAAWAYCVSSGLLAVTVLLAPTDPYEQRRTASGNEDDVAALLAVACVLALYLALTATAARVPVGIGLAVLAALGVIATGARTGVVAAGAGVLVVLLQALLRGRRGGAVRIAIAGALGAVVVLQLPTDFVPPRISSTAEAFAAGEFSGRQDIWQAILVRGIDLGGIGLGSSDSYLLTMLGERRVAHNLVLGILLELGLIGLLLFGLMLVAAAVRWRASAFRAVLLPLALVIGLMSMTLSIEWRRCLWLVVAFALTAVPARRALTERHERGAA